MTKLDAPKLWALTAISLAIILYKDWQLYRAGEKTMSEFLREHSKEIPAITVAFCIPIGFFLGHIWG